MKQDLSNASSTRSATRAAAHQQHAAGVASPAVDPLQPAQETPVESTPEHTSTAAAAIPPFQLKPPAPASQDKTSPTPQAWPVVQRQVIQLVWNVDTELASAQGKKTTALVKITAGKYDEAMDLYTAVKGIMAEVFSRNYLGTDKVYKKHTTEITGYVTEIIESFKTTLEAKVAVHASQYRDLYNQYESEYNALYDQIAAGLTARTDVTALGATLNEKIQAHLAALTQFKEAADVIDKFNNEKVKIDTELKYKTGEKTTGTILKTKLAPLDVTPLTDEFEKNKRIGIAANKWQAPAIKKTTDAPGDDALRNTAILQLAAGTKIRLEAISAVFADAGQQLSIFTQINKHHRSEAITDVVALFQATGTGQLAAVLALIEVVGVKGKIGEITAFYTATRTVKGGAPALAALTDFVGTLAYTTLGELNGFVREAAPHGDLTAIGLAWAAAKTNNKVEETTALLKAGGVPESLLADTFKIAADFAGAKGKSKAADWTKLLGVTGWEKENLFALTLAFDSNSGNVSAERWAAAAKKEPALQTKLDELRATARLNEFASEEWYTNTKTSKLSSAKKAQKKYTQLLYALLGDKDLTGLGDVNFENIKGDFLSMLVFFHKHIASFNATGAQGFDREETGGGSYARSSDEHPLNVQYRDLISSQGGTVKDLLQPLNSKLLALQDKGVKSKDDRGVTARTVSPADVTYRTGGISGPSAGLPSHNLKVLKDQQEIIGSLDDPATAITDLFGAKPPDVKPAESRTIGDKAATTDALLAKQKAALSGKIKTAYNDENLHDGLLQDRGALVTSLSNAINGITGGPQVLRAIGSEGHPSVVLKVPKVAGKYHYNGIDYTRTKMIVPLMVAEFNAAAGQEVKLTERGSFGFQRPTLADTSDSVRLWPGYAPVETLLPGLAVLVEKLTSKTTPATTKLGNIAGLTSLTTNNKVPILYVDALKAAMRHAFIVLEKKVDGSAPAEKKRVAEWLRTRILIKLQQSGILIEKGDALYADGSAATQQQKNKHFLVTADMTDKLQEYSMLYTAATLDATANPNERHTDPGKFKDSNDAYEKKIVAKLRAADYRMFYLDSGEQALITAGILANRFLKAKDETSTNVAASNYRSLNPYFEVGTFGGDRRSNLEKEKGASGYEVVHADLSPVITTGIDRPKPKLETERSIKESWQDGRGALNKPAVIPILDITNSSIEAVSSLGAMPRNFIIVESLTKHEQLGADKFSMGRLIAVSNTEGTKAGALKSTNFLDLAQKVVGPVANEAFNPLLAQVRANMDKVLYSDAIA